MLIRIEWCKMNRILYKCIATTITLSVCTTSFAQDKRSQYPPALLHSYFGIDIGYIGYQFSTNQLEPGFSTQSIHIPHTGVRVVFGHHFNKYLAAELAYLRPVGFVEYENVNGNGRNYKVGMNIVGLTLKPSLPLSQKLEVKAEAGIGIVTRGGFIVGDVPGVRDAAYASFLLGGGIDYRINDKWHLALNATWSPANDGLRQPATVFYSGGFRYNILPISKEKQAQVDASGVIFPWQVIQVAYTTNIAGYGVNNFVSKEAHIFWGGGVKIKNGLSIDYQRNIFHSRKVFSLDWGGGVSYWTSRQDKEKLFTITVYPVFRYTAIRTKPTDLYFVYSFAGPAFISKTFIDGMDTGKYFTFQDFMGIGMFGGKTRNLNAEIRIMHYSNGNIFPQNNGLMIPLTFALGYCINQKMNAR